MVKYENGSTAFRKTFTVRHLLAATGILAIPIALFCHYWFHVNNTVDQRTIPFSDAPLVSRLFLFAAGASVAIIVIGAVASLFVRKNWRLATILTVFAIAATLVAIPLVVSKIISPIRGNAIAALHNDASSVVALAVLRYFEQTKRWPANWDDLDNDISVVLGEIASTKSSANPFADGDDATDSIKGRAPDLSNLDSKRIRTIVDIDFKADPGRLAQQSWIDFQGITPHKPSYNLYRIEFQQLIDGLKQHLAVSETVQ